MRILAVFVFTLSVSLVFTGCIPKKYQKDPSNTSQEKTATLENQTNEKYQAYSASVIPEGQKMILFFHADWCPTCVAWEKELIEKADTLPENTQIFKVDFDTETQLRAQYGVTQQSTAVFIDESGRVRKTAADPSIEAVAHFFSQETPKEVEKFDPNKDKYQSYSAARMSGEKVALFFHAEWCPTCRKWEADLKTNLSKMPANTRILKVDYDTMKELVKDYGVTKQSTVVFLDEKGNVTKKLMDPPLEKVAEFFGATIKIESEKKEEPEAVIEEFMIGSNLVDCVGVGPQKCMVVNGKNFYDSIDGFEYEEGYNYKLRVRKETVENPPADSSAFSYSLIEVVMQESAVTDTQEEADEAIREEEEGFGNDLDEEVSEPEAKEVTIESEVEVAANVSVQPRYEVYSEQLVKDLSGKKYILNFHADWCPNCRQLNSEIEGLLGTFPEGTVILKTDYDQYVELKKQYGVTQQTTFVMINADGTHTTKPAAAVEDIKTFFN